MPIVNRVAAMHEEITAWRRDLHAHPELGFDVHRTAGIVADKLKAFGCDEIVPGMAIPIFEPGLDELVATNVQGQAARLHHGSAGPVAEADAVFIAVGTPSRRGDGHADLSYVYAAAREIAAALYGLHRHRHQIDRAGRHRR